jgi:hypothetical protein
MNLSRIENYFSTFLSHADDLRKGKEIKIPLFSVIINSEAQYENIKLFLEDYF